MFNIDVDLTGLMSVMDEVKIDTEALQKGLVSAAIFVRDVWRSAVSGNVLPGMSRAVNDDKYASALTTGDSIRLPTAFHALVIPVGYSEEISRIEEGQPAYDMKPGLLNGPKSRPIKSTSRTFGNSAVGYLGRYNTVPFRHYTPASDSGGSTAISIRMRMPNDVFSQAKKLKRSLPNSSNGKINWDQSLDWDAPPATSFTGYVHQSNVYQGMYRVGDARNSQYLTFRRVSTPRVVNGKRKGSAPGSWWHPSTPANPVIQAVYDYCMPQVESNLIKLAQSMVY